MLDIIIYGLICITENMRYIAMAIFLLLIYNENKENFRLPSIKDMRIEISGIVAILIYSAITGTLFNIELPIILTIYIATLFIMKGAKYKGFTLYFLDVFILFLLSTILNIAHLDGCLTTLIIFIAYMGYVVLKNIILPDKNIMKLYKLNLK